MTSALCFASCENTSPDGTVSTSSPSAGQPSDDSAQNDEYIPEKDADGYKIEVAEVTDAQGDVVKDDAGNPVTELNIVDDKGAVITDASGNKAKPNIPAKPSKSSASPSGADNGNNGGNGSNGNNGNSESSENNAAPLKPADELVAMLWYADVANVNGKAVFKNITSDTEILDITFKIKDGAKNGKYEIQFFEDSDRSPSFCNDGDPIKDLDIKYIPGYIGVNETAEDTAVPDSGLSFAVTSASGKPGDTVTVKCSLKNVTEPIAAFNAYLAYDTSALEPVSVSKTGFISTSGVFSSNIN